jgi:hypothetical protein
MDIWITESSDGTLPVKLDSRGRSVTVMPMAGRTAAGLRAQLRVGRRGVVPVIAALIIIGAVVTWGPIGLGNGPLSVVVHGAEGWTDAGQTPAGFIIPIFNSGHGQAVIDAVTIVGGTSYAGPRELGLDVLSADNCAGAESARPDGRAFVLLGCGGRDQGALAGYALGATRFVPAAAEAAAPRPGTCRVLTKIVVRYHVGIRHYAATEPYALAVCGRGTASARVLAAMQAAQSSPG